MDNISNTSPAIPQRHPKGLYTLFFTEMWERCSYYGMRALLILFMTNSISQGGLGFSDATAGAIYGLYTASVYLSALPGGWVADRLLGAQNAVWVGGIIIAIGQFTLAIPRNDTFFLGLLFIILGTGLLKPNVSTIVGKLYPEGGARRDAGFTLFYMGINLGAVIGPLICGYLGEKVSWRLGFSMAGMGMIFGLIQFHYTKKHLGDAGICAHKSITQSRDTKILAAGLLVLAMVVLVVWTGVLRIDVIAFAQTTKWIILGIAVLFFGYIFLFGDLTAEEKRRVGVIVILFLSSALFWSGFEQAGSSFNLFAQRNTVRDYFGWNMPAGWFQMAGPAFVISLAPVAAAVWIALSRRNCEPSLGVKFSMGLMLLGVGFLVMVVASKRAGEGQVWPSWLLLTFFLHTIAELCVSPVGLSSVTKLAPNRFVGQMMGVWFLATSLGNLIAGLVAGEAADVSGGGMSAQFLQMAIAAVGLGVVLLLFSKPMQQWMKGVK